MNDFVILVDSTSDMGKELRDKYNVDYAQMTISYDDKELPASLNWDEYSPKELYDLMRKGKRVKTALVSYEEFLNKFTKYLSEGKNILYLACSTALSGSINVARTVKEDIEASYPERKIILIDTLISCLGQAMIAIDASKMRSEGKTIEEVAQYVEENKLKYNQVATVENLDYLRKSGRVKTSTALLGNLFGVKPIIISDVIGQNYAFKKVKGRIASLNYLVEFTKENIIDSENQIIYIGHADSIEDANYLKEHILKEVKCQGVYIDYIGPCVGATTGPGTLGVYFKGKEVTIKGE